MITMRNPLTLYPLGLLNYALFILPLIPINTIYYFSMLLIPLVILPFMILINQLIIGYYLDLFINKTHFPQIYRKGMYQDEPNNTAECE